MPNFHTPEVDEGIAKIASALEKLQAAEKRMEAESDQLKATTQEVYALRTQMAEANREFEKVIQSIREQGDNAVQG